MQGRRPLSLRDSTVTQGLEPGFQVPLPPFFSSFFFKAPDIQLIFMVHQEFRSGGEFV